MRTWPFIDFVDHQYLLRVVVHGRDDSECVGPRMAEFLCAANHLLRSLCVHLQPSEFMLSFD